eukprot:6354198-Pyramimonas_sp.AAC.1
MGKGARCSTQAPAVARLLDQLHGRHLPVTTTTDDPLLVALPDHRRETNLGRTFASLSPRLDPAPRKIVARVLTYQHAPATQIRSKPANVAT